MSLAAATMILGIDPGSQRTGYGVVQRFANGQYKYLDSGCIRTVADTFPQRLRTIFEGVQQLISQYNIQEVVIEQVFMNKNANSALKLGQARGAALAAAALRDMLIHEYTPAQIKQALVGKGNATKPQVQQMVKILLGLAFTPGADAADALAGILCHCHHYQFNQCLGAQSYKKEKKMTWTRKFSHL